MANIIPNQTPLAKSIGSSDVWIPLTSVANITLPNDMAWIDRELLQIDAINSTMSPPQAKVRRGIGGTAAVSHGLGATVTTGPPTIFYGSDPVGVPAPGSLPYWINVKTGVIWVAQGDEAGPGAVTRYWAPQVVTYSIGSLGVRNVSVSPL